MAALKPYRIWIVLGAIVALCLMLGTCGMNSIPTAQENARTKWADVQTQYQRRADLIPNLQRTIEGFTRQEREVLTQVTQARARASSVQVDPTDEGQMQQFAQAQGALSQSLGRLLVTVERYPELRSSELFARLQDELAGTENRINNARRDYNQAVRDYNVMLRTFPTMINGWLRGARPMALFEAEAGAERAPEVKFGQ